MSHLGNDWGTSIVDAGRFLPIALVGILLFGNQNLCFAKEKYCDHNESPMIVAELAKGQDANPACFTN